MEFEWDEAKRQTILDSRGIDLLYAALIFDGPVLTKQDTREDYGELRYISLGLVEDVPYIVIHTDREGRIRLISAWKGGRKDYERYKESLS